MGSEATNGFCFPFRTGVSSIYYCCQNNMQGQSHFFCAFSFIITALFCNIRKCYIRLYVQNICGAEDMEKSNLVLAKVFQC